MLVEEDEGDEGDDREERGDDEEPVVATGVADDVASGEGTEREGNRVGEEVSAGLRSRVLLDDLEELRVEVEDLGEQENG